MDLPSPEHRRVKITTGGTSTAKASKGNNSKALLKDLGTSRPFTRQVDVIFPSSDNDGIVQTDAEQLEPAVVPLGSALAKLGKGKRYAVGQVKLADVVSSAATGSFAEYLVGDKEKWVTMLSIDAHTDDVWCIDPRGLLTLQVAKDTYQRLGLVGKKLPFKGQSDYYVIRLPLRKNADSVTNQKRRYEALKVWDERREREGLGAWNVLCSCSDVLPEAISSTMAHTHDVECQVTHIKNVRIPISSSLRCDPSTSLSKHTETPDHDGHSQSKASGSDIDGRKGIADDDDEILEDYNVRIAGLFEWVGMACLGSQRLIANDRVDPYIAVYECPEPSYVGSLTHLRWTGFINSALLQSIIDTALASIQHTVKETDHPTQAAGTEDRSFVALTAHAYSSSPVTYIPPSPLPSSSTYIEDRPVRLARLDGEDTWSLFAIPGSIESSDSDINTSEQGIEWVLVESLGQYDTRWG